MDYMEKRKIEIRAIKEFMESIQEELKQYDDIDFVQAYISGKTRAYQEMDEIFNQ